jgi:nitrite reductase/ring-hydroxylating ferredoxin subunit
MQTTVKKVKNPLENISRRSVLGVMGVGMTGVLIGCNDDVSPLKLSLKSSATGEVTSASEVMLTATVGAGFAQTIEFYESSPSSADSLVGSVSANPNPLTEGTNRIKYTSADNGTHTYYGKVTSVTGKDAPSNPIVVKVNIPVTQTVLPTVTLSSSSTTLTAPGTIKLTADVTGGTVTQIEFFDGTTSLGVVATAPYTTDFVFAASPNSHSFKAVGSSLAGPATSNTVTVTLNIPLPTITLAATPNPITAAGDVTLTATVAGGAVTKVEFFEGTTLLGSASAAPYSIKIPFTATSPAQTHNYVAKGTVAGVTATVDSTAVAVNVNIGNLAPTITLGSSSLSVIANGGITLTAVPTAKTGTIAKVEFFDSASPTPTVPVSTVTAAPWEFKPTFTAANNATHNYTAKATDSSGNSATSTPAVAVTVNITTAAPTITLTSSSNSVAAAGSVTLTAVTTPDPAVTISKVDFYDSASATPTVPVFTKTVAPYTYAPAYTGANNGTHNYTAKATDSSGKSTTSTSVVVTVNIPVVAPTVLLTATPSGTVLTAGAIALSASVTPGSGTITKVEFFEGATSLGSTSVSPYTLSTPAYTSANNGPKSYTAKVTASDGGTVTSAAVSITLKIVGTTNPGTLIALYTALPAAGSYINFNHPTSGIKCILFRAPTAQTGGVTNASAFYVAYSRKCTHKGTVITNNPTTANPHTLTCQDHGAKFNLDTNCSPTNSPISGTSFGALLTIAITVGTDGIYI